MSFTLQLRTWEDGTVLECHGQLVAGEDLAAARAAMGAVLRGENRLIISLEGITRIDAAGLGLVAAISAEARTRGASVVWCGARPAVRQVFKVAHLHELLEPQNSESLTVKCSGTAA